MATTRSSSSTVERWEGRQAGIVLYVLALVTVVVGVDVLFFRHRFWERLMVNVGICPGVRGVLFEVPEASMSGTRPMNAANDNAARKGLRRRWASPPRPGMQRLINPWEYRFANRSERGPPATIEPAGGPWSAHHGPVALGAILPAVQSSHIAGTRSRDP
jgi:hypothetical protein